MHDKIGLTFHGVLFTASLLAPCVGHATAFFLGLGDLPGGTVQSTVSEPGRALSADGSTVVGWSRSANGAEAFRWTQSGGIVGLGDLPGGLFVSNAVGVSADGSVIVGRGQAANGAAHAFRRSESTGMVDLGDLPGGLDSSIAIGVSADGSVVAGTGSSADGPQAFRWTAATGMVPLGDLPGGSFDSQALNISADGSTVVGNGRSSLSGSGSEAFRWTAATGMVGLGDLPGGLFASQAFDVSADGAVIVGHSSTASGAKAFRWTESTGMVALDPLAAFAYGITPDATTIVGSGSVVGGAYLWDAARGMVSIRNLLVDDLGLDLTGWNLQRAVSISADGLTIVGQGRNPLGQDEAWIAYLGDPSTASTPAPEPGTAALLALGVALAGLRGRRAARRKQPTRRSSTVPVGCVSAESNDGRP